MLKVRLMGQKNEIRWFLRVLGRNPKIQLENTSTFYNNKGTERFKRLYTEVHRIEKGSKKSNKKNDATTDSVKDIYCGSGKTFC